MDRLRILIACLANLLLSAALAGQPLSVDDVPVIVLDQGQMSVMRDPSGNLTLDDARAAHAQGRFKPLKGNLGAGYVPDAFWLHFSLDRSTSQPEVRWLEVIPPYLDDIQLFHIDAAGNVDRRQGGDFVPQSAKEETYRGTLFKLNLAQGNQGFYLRLKTTSAMTAIVKLWQPDAFIAHLRHSYFAFGAYFSLILTVLLFNAVNWGISGRPIFIAYALYLLSSTACNGWASPVWSPSSCFRRSPCWPISLWVWPCHWLPPWPSSFSRCCSNCHDTILASIA